jgi:hypothetical protein
MSVICQKELAASNVQGEVIPVFAALTHDQALGIYRSRFTRLGGKQELTLSLVCLPSHCLCKAKEM